MYIHTLKVTDFRSFASTGELALMHPARGGAASQGTRPAPLPNVTVIIGDNGSGKSSILKALCYGVFHEAAATLGLRSVRNVRRVKPRGGDAPNQAPPERAVITVGAVGDHAQGEAERFERTTHLTRLSADTEKIEAARPAHARWRPFTTEGAADAGPSWEEVMARANGADHVLVAYGADRQIAMPESYDPGARSSGRHPRVLRVASLLDPGPFTLVPLGSWLTESARRDEILGLLRGALPEATGVTPTDRVEGKEVLFDDHGVHLPLSALSDGYQAFIGWVGDLLYHLASCAPPGVALDTLSGVVLVDEIDLHLHPRWQQQVVERVARTFPRIQFVLTTHSALVIGGLRKENVFAVRRAKDGTSGVRALRSEVWGRTPDQLLLDPIFGLEHTRDQAFMELLRRVEARAIGGDAEAARYLNALIAFGGAADGPPAGVAEWVRAAARRRGIPE
ncbi:MAG: AAA family ATPase [bacterium]